MNIGIQARTNLIQLKKVFEPIVLISAEGEELSICMRDTGFEIMYDKELYQFKQNKCILPKDQTSWNLKRIEDG